MGFLLGGAKTQAKQAPAVGGMQVQTSAYGKVIAVVFGTTRIAPNLLGYYDFLATPQSSGGRAGKGGVGGGGGGKGGQGGQEYLYQASIQFAVCEGPIQKFGTVYKDKNVTSTAELGMSTFLGTYPQAAWDYLVSNHGSTAAQITVPSVAPYQVQISTPNTFIADLGIVGPPSVATFTRVSVSPGPGQYSLNAIYNYAYSDYTFNTADRGKTVIIRYVNGYNGVQASVQQIIPTSGSPVIRINAMNGFALTDQGVTSTNIGYIPVTGAPAANQYRVIGGLYTFNAANAGAVLTVNYAATDTAKPFQAIGYTGLAHADVANYQLGNSPHLSNHNFEIYGIYSNSVAGSQDADPSLVVTAITSDDKFGVAFPLSKWGDLTTYQNYCLATGLLISAAYAEQTPANQVLEDIALATNSEFVWSGATLKLVPYGDTIATGNGKTYTPPSVPLFTITLNDLIFSPGDDPVQLNRKNVSDSINSIKLEVLNRTNQYSIAIVEAKDQAAIDAYKLRQNTASQTHLFTDMAAATTSANLQLQRQRILNQYTFTLVEPYIVLDPMDVISIPMPDGTQQLVRIKEMDENDDGSITFQAEDYLSGAGTAAPSYSFQQWGGFSANYNSDPGTVNTPVIFEPTAQLAEALEVWLGVSGGDNWGGADVYISNDGDTYAFTGRITGPARTGVLTGSMPTAIEAPTGPTIDTTTVVGVDLSQSNGELLSASQQEALNLATLCWIDGEFMAYQNATLTAANKFDLSFFVRGAYESDISAHAVGSQFVRCDDGLLKIPFTQDRIGQTLYIKFLSFNVYGGAQQALETVSAFTYTFQGTAYKSPLPDITNLRQLFIAQIAQIVWDEVVDFRPVLYEIRKGPTSDSGQIMGRFAHPPFNLVGDDSYWIAAYSQPVPGLQVYSENWFGVTVLGSSLTDNVIASWDERATGWSGTCSGYAAVVGSEVVTTGTGNFLGITDFLGLMDFLWNGGQGNGTYTIPTAHRIILTVATPCPVLISWTAYGQHPGLSFLAYPDFLAVTDILDLGSSVNIDVYPEIRMSQDFGATWGAWQKYVAGVYVGNAFDARVQLITYDPTVQAHLSQLVFKVDVPDRVDHYTNLAIGTGGLSITFKLDGTVTAAPFNGGPGGALVPNIQVTILNASPGDDVVVSSVTLSGCTVQVVNGGSPVARNANVIAQGF